jgi:hypothetical protein
MTLPPTRILTSRGHDTACPSKTDLTLEKLDGYPEKLLTIVKKIHTSKAEAPVVAVEGKWAERPLVDRL